MDTPYQKRSFRHIAKYRKALGGFLYKVRRRKEISSRRLYTLKIVLFVFSLLALNDRAWSILAETEEPTVLTSFFRNRKEPEPNFSKKSEPY